MKASVFAPAPVDTAFDLLFQTLEQSNDAVLVLDGQSRVLLFNAAAEKLWGVPRAQALGEPLHRFLPCPVEGGAELPDHACAAHWVGGHREVMLERGDGRRVTASLTMSPVDAGSSHFHTAVLRDFTDVRLQRERMRQLSLVVDRSDNAIFVSAPNRQVLYVNSGFTRMLGYELDDLRSRKPSEVLSGPHTEPQLGDLIERSLALSEGMQTEVLLYTKSGRPLWVSAAINPVLDDDGRTIGLVSVLTDITQTKAHQVLHHKVLDAMVREQPVTDVMTLMCREVERIAPEVAVSVLAVDGDGRLRPLAAPSLPTALVTACDGLAIGPRVGACGTAAWRGRPVHVPDIATDPLMSGFRDLLLGNGLHACFSSPIKSSSGRVLGTLCFYYRERGEPNDLHRRIADTCLHLCALAMEREQTNERVHQLAFYDTLTGLPNRIMFSAKAEQVLANSAQLNSQAAVLFIDVDRFKRVNEAQGHAAGDGLLRDIAARLAEELPGPNLIGRQAGDEFVAVLPQCSTEQAASVAERLLGAIARPATAGVMTLHPSASIGVAIYPDDGRDIDLLLRHADMAMYRAKSDGGGSVRFFSGDMNRVAQERVSLETAMREALLADQFSLHYQPQISGGGEPTLYGVEALLRWEHPELGIVPPSRFVPVAEECGLIADLSLWVLEHACAQMADWRRRGLRVPRVAVNVSAINFRDPDLSLQIASCLDAHGLHPDDLILEITESVMLDPNPDVLENIEAIYVMGVRLSLDDFGTGYSSLSHLHRLPIYELKLDQSFVRDIDSSAIARTLTTSVLRIGESLSMKVVAEGVETGAQHAFLAEQGFPVLQGYLFSAPLPAPALEHWLGNNDYVSMPASGDGAAHAP
ncbi:EAL domain-containing protein [Pseudomonas sp. R2.Fl]|nr:EAL domain-containing protein [Pseudomonas sp. R2.Fl]